jgi:DNA-damage-inducible protein J
MASLHIRIDDKTKKKVQKILGDLGLDMSTAVNMYFSQIAMHEGIPFTIERERRVPKHIMEKWEREVQEALKNGKRYTNVSTMMADILKGEDDE